MSVNGLLMTYHDTLFPVQDYSVTMTMDAGGRTLENKTIKLGKKMRMEIAQSDLQIVSIVDPEADDGKGVAYALRPTMKTYTKLPIPPGAFASALAKAEDIKDSVKIEVRGKEDVDGVPCDKRSVTITDNDKPFTITQWTSPQNKNMPVKMTIDDMVIRYKDYDFTKPSADLFTVPADYKANDMGGRAR